MSDLEYPVNDFDNHYYEAMDAFTRHLDPRSSDAASSSGPRSTDASTT